MLIRDSSQIQEDILPNSDLKGKLLMQHPYDDMGFSAYQVNLKAGRELNLKGVTHSSVLGQTNYSHAYFCIQGLITASSITNKSSTMGPYVLKNDSFHILPFSVSLQSNVEKDSSLIVIYVPEESTKPPQNIVSATLGDLNGGEREVKWGNGTSYRFLIEEDGYPISITHASYDNDTTSKLEYDEFLKTNLFYKGSIEISYGLTGNEKAAKLQCKDDYVIMVSANENDRHSLTTHKSCTAINIFSPALKGKEAHDWSTQEYSGF